MGVLELDGVDDGLGDAWGHIKDLVPGKIGEGKRRLRCGHFFWIDRISDRINLWWRGRSNPFYAHENEQITINLFIG